ncbi:hypothetical protein Zm00014a_032578 [Zea mays]|jgi:hypothetical protein|uniref:Uncharacterized protein n=2 Tax=Zea mays TaxID=4577 RepID=A0A8J8Y661_MAIZE|nr:hypothetical protein ZEAMMB73_Zm00001d036379 [Zea mays]PWZ19320.1 hypothetical protein Zm00014a_032578 [Zea mays]
MVPAPAAATVVAEVELSGVLAEALDAMVSASATVFSALEVASYASSKKPAAMTMLMSLVTRSSKATTTTSDEDRELVALEKMERLDDCAAEIEAETFRHKRYILGNNHT